MRGKPIVHRDAPSSPVSIFIAGDLRSAEEACRRYCFDQGLCVTVTPTTYVYTGGAEAGVIVGLINYPRFAATPDAIFAAAESLAEYLMDALYQGSCTVQSLTTTRWMSRRGD